jgi:hypothetical protein
MKMEPIESSETSASNIQTPGIHPKERKLYLEHGENLKSYIHKFNIHCSKNKPFTKYRKMIMIIIVRKKWTIGSIGLTTSATEFSFELR